MQLWPRVLHATADLAIPAARAAVGTFLVLQSESASCERVFARAEYIRKNLHEQKDGQLVEQYLWVGQGPPVRDCETVVARAVKVYMAVKERRDSCNIAGRIYYKGRKARLSRRQRRSDAGTIGAPDSVRACSIADALMFLRCCHVRMCCLIVYCICHGYCVCVGIILAEHSQNLRRRWWRWCLQ